MVDEHPLPWLAPLLNGVEHANFFETARDRIFEGRDARELERRVGQFRPAAEGEGQGAKRRTIRRSRRKRAAQPDGDMFSAAGVAAE